MPEAAPCPTSSCWPGIHTELVGKALEEKMQSEVANSQLAWVWSLCMDGFLPKFETDVQTQPFQENVGLK